MITVIIPTGDRPLAFALCQKWLLMQSRQPDQIIIVDDGKTPIPPIIPCDYIRREPLPGDPPHTLNLNMLEALKHVKHDHIIIFEDDEYYGPDYLAEMEKWFPYGELIGIGYSKYYHLPSGGYSRHENAFHASWAQSAFRSSMIPRVRLCAQGKDRHYLDVRVWRSIGGEVMPGTLAPGGKKIGTKGYLFDDSKMSLYVGMKGLPGRPGIGAGHKASMYNQRDDANRSVLKKWVPQDYSTYIDVLRLMGNA